MTIGNKRSVLTLLPVALSAMLLSACGGGSNGSSDGSLSLGVTDAPVDSASKVIVEFDGVEVQPADGERITFDFDQPRQIDLLQLRGGISRALLEDESVPPGDYEWVRLMVDADGQASSSHIVMDDGSVYPLRIPSGAQTGLKLQGGFTVPENGQTLLTVDFDLRKSVHKPGQSGRDYILRPALRMVQNDDVGTIEGTVDQSTASASGCHPAAYLYAGSDVQPDDLGSTNEPLTTTSIEMNDSNGAFEFTFAFIPAGDYTVAWTCAADQDMPDTNEDIPFEAQTNVTVEAGSETTAGF